MRDVMDAAEIARLRAWVARGGICEAIPILDALEQAQKERDEANKRFEVEHDQVTHLHSVLAEQDGLSVTQSICFDRVVSERDHAQKDAKDARALLGEAKPFVGWCGPSGDILTRIEAMLERKL